MNQGFVDSAPAHLNGIPCPDKCLPQAFRRNRRKIPSPRFYPPFFCKPHPHGSEYRNPLRSAFCKNSFLHGNVNVHGFMSVQMVGCNIQHCANMRMKFLRLFHLEAADFRNHPILFRSAALPPRCKALQCFRQPPYRCKPFS